jgi:hypothetical protein
MEKKCAEPWFRVHETFKSMMKGANLHRKRNFGIEKLIELFGKEFDDARLRVCNQL